MLFNAPITLLLAIAPMAIFAAPTATSPLEKRSLRPDIVSKLQDGTCDLKKAQMPTAPTPLPAPSDGLVLSHVAIGRGTQNYTCATSTTDSAPKAIGALATLFNMTCLAATNPSVVADITKLAINYQIPKSEVANIIQSGHHEFTSDGFPLFKLVTPAANFGWIQAKAAANSPAPAGSSAGTNGLGSVPWLKLTGTAGTLKEVYRLNTAGGVAPKTCDQQPSTFTVDYAAEYWFWK